MRARAVFLILLAACSPIRSVVVDATPTTPPRTACVPETNRCNGLVPEICVRDEDGSGVTRWWPLHGLNNGLVPARCAHACAVVDNVASCTAQEVSR